MTFPQRPQQPFGQQPPQQQPPYGQQPYPRQLPFGQQFPPPGPAGSPFPPLPPQKGFPAKLQRLSEAVRDPRRRKKLILGVLLGIVGIFVLVVGLVFLIGVVLTK
ncbi:hypothetical protein ACIBCH_02075 [Amycolatopsis thailandensis]|uniref:hypothetical protein n=1 Tax=Amycolatopsis thailandensis TaxID=589330 RepID=UPI0037892D9C